MALMTKIKAQLVYQSKERRYQCQGSWSITELDGLPTSLEHEALPDEKNLIISGKDLLAFDSSGALALMNFLTVLHKHGKKVELIDFTKKQTSLIDLVNSKKSTLNYKIPPKHYKNPCYIIGEQTMDKIDQAKGFVTLLGDLVMKLTETFGHWRRFRFPSIVSNINSAGLQALPIVALLSFLIGIVLAYQMGLQLQTYGANIFIAYLSGMAVFREFAPLITAIIVAGRTSSAFTAQLGSMKVNEEIDALQTMGLSPTELLVMPKVFAMLIVFPLLIFWSDFFSIVGAMIMSKAMLGVSYYDFLNRLKDSVGLKQLMLGLYKAPAFALIIAMVGCYQGFLVQPNADSVGSQTTKSVVQALFLIIIADAAFSIIYSWMGI
jgi:phospholipid/cholesterol/gamma-HCH transport system permease protein